MKRLYELVLWDAGDKKQIGYFETKKEAVDALRLAKKYYANGNERLEERLIDGMAAYEIIRHEYGFTVSAGIWIKYNQDKELERKNGQGQV